MYYSTAAIFKGSNKSVCQCMFLCQVRAIGLVSICCFTFFFLPDPQQGPTTPLSLSSPPQCRRRLSLWILPLNSSNHHLSLPNTSPPNGNVNRYSQHPTTQNIHLHFEMAYWEWTPGSGFPYDLRMTQKKYFFLFNDQKRVSPLLYTVFCGKATALIVWCNMYNHLKKTSIQVRTTVTGHL